MSVLLRFRTERRADGVGQAVPALCFFAQPAAARGRQPVELRPAVVIRNAPFPIKQPFMLEFLEGRV